MPPRARRHHEQHFQGRAWVRDVVLGVSDGLTVPFALAAGLSGALLESRVVLLGGAAELVAGGISMGLGGYLASRAEADSYHAELAREQREVREVPEEEALEVREIFARYGLSGEALENAVRAVTSNPNTWVSFMMREELSLHAPDPRGPLLSGLTIGLAYVAGGLVPLLPYAVTATVHAGFSLSAVVTLLALLAFGAIKARYTGMRRLVGALQTAATGSAAAAAAYALARGLSRFG